MLHAAAINPKQSEIVLVEQAVLPVESKCCASSKPLSQCWHFTLGHAHPVVLRKVPEFAPYCLLTLMKNYGDALHERSARDGTYQH